MDSKILALKDTYKRRFKQSEKLEYSNHLVELTKEVTGKEAYVHEGGKNARNVHTDIKECDVILTAHYDTGGTRTTLGRGGYSIAPKATFFGRIVVLTVIILMLLGYKRLSETYEWYAILNGIVIWLIILAPFIPRIRGNKTNLNNNTSGVMVAFAVAERFKDDDRVGLVFFDGKEKRRKGSKAFYKEYRKDLKKKVIINLDCVSGVDDTITLSRAPYHFYLTEEYDEVLDALIEAFERSGRKVLLQDDIISSDYESFSESVSINISETSRNSFGYHITRSHSKKDNILNEERMRGTISALTDGVKRVLNK